MPGVYHANVAYVSLQSLAEIPGISKSTSLQKHKTTLRIGRQRFTFSRLSSLIATNSEIYRIPYQTEYINGALHIPAAALPLLSRLTHRDFDLSDQPLAHSKPVPSTRANRFPTRPPTPQTTTLPSKPQTVRDWRLTTVVIDPGHGGKDPGALGHSGSSEKVIALGVAKQLQKLLERSLKVNVVLTRSDDTFIPLHKRSQIALQKGGKVFISLHCNATKNRSASGVEVYFLSEAKTQDAADVAQTENAVIEYEENQNEENEGLDNIVMGLLSHQFLKESQDLAADIHDAIVNRVPNIKKRGVKQANFHVMRGTMANMPSVLVELGFITNKQEEKQLKTSRHQKRLAEGLYRGIKAFKLRYEQQFSTKN